MERSCDYSQVNNIGLERMGIEGMSLPVFLCTDNNYAVPAYITMYSLLMNYTGTEKLRLYLLTSNDFESRYIRLFKSLKGNYELKIIKIRNSFDEVVINTSWITTATMYRLLIPKIAGNLGAERCIYLDSDIIVEGDIKELFEVDLNDFCIGAVKESIISCDRDPEMRKRLGVPSLKNYINAGVLLFNLDEIEKLRLSKELEQQGYTSDYLHNDQDVINVVFYDRIKILPVRFNAINDSIYNPDSFLQYGIQNIKEARKNPLIVHYTGKYKPWVCRETILARKWWKYVRMQERKIQKAYIRPFVKSHKLPWKESMRVTIRSVTMRMGIFTATRELYHRFKGAADSIRSGRNEKIYS